MCNRESVHKWIAPILVLIILLALPSYAPAEAGAQSAGCGGVVTAKAKKRVAKNMPPLIVGDSVLLGAVSRVAAQGFTVNARGCRGWSEGLAVLRGYQRRGALPHLVVMSLGTNWSIRVADIRKALRITGRRRVLAVMTPREVGGYPGRDAAAVRKAGKLYPGHVVVLDWAADTKGKPGWFGPDGVHLTWSGIAGMAKYLKSVLKYAPKSAMPGKSKPETD